MKTMEYISTRGETPPMSFKDAVMTGLARDGGLMIPAGIPQVEAQLEQWSVLEYEDLAFEIMRLFTEVGENELRHLLHQGYATFRHQEVTPVLQVGNLHILELFHGPTLAFKDVALQFLGRLFGEILGERNEHMNILAATSGDTGSAAIAGVRGQSRINIFVMHPHKRVSALQERQMTTVLDDNVFNLAVQGSFDDCQRIMKSIFNDLAFKDQYALGAVNSVNWARVLSQVVYYFYSAFRVMERTGAERVQFSVPTGNFGDILAGYYAWRMGLPISRLILATNENDILARFFNTGEYSLGKVVPTLSPSMDIQVASNFERWLYYKAGEKPAQVRQWMEAFSQTGKMVLPCSRPGHLDEIIVAGTGNTEKTLGTIKKYYEQHNYLLDPHTAVGVYVAEQYNEMDDPTICLATAHPAKFPDAIRQAIGQDLAHHPLLDGIKKAKTRCEVIPAEQSAVQEFISKKALFSN